MIPVGMLLLWLLWGETLDPSQGAGATMVDPSFLFLSHLFSLDYAFKENYGKSLVEIF